MGFTVFTCMALVGASMLMLSGCDADKNISLCGQLGMCPKEKVEKDEMCEIYHTCPKEDGEEDDKKVEEHHNTEEQQY